MHPVVKECLENAQSLRRVLGETRDEIPDSAVGERLIRMERMLTYLLAGLDYLARGNDGNERSVLFDTLDELDIEGIGPDPHEPWQPEPTTSDIVRARQVMRRVETVTKSKRQ